MHSIAFRNFAPEKLFFHYINHLKVCVMIETIGSNAGLVWNALDAENNQTLKSLKKATKLKDKEIYAALGWLAREGKINMEAGAEDVVVTLL